MESLYMKDEYPELEDLAREMDKLYMDTNNDEFDEIARKAFKLSQKSKKISKKIRKRIKGFKDKYPNNRYSDKEIELIAEIGLTKFTK